MDFLGSNFFKNEPFFSYKLGFTVIKTIGKHSLNVKKCPSNVLITGESNLDERNE